MSTDDTAAWREERRQAAREQGDRLAERQATESAKALAMLAEFVGQARAAGIRDQPLRARSLSGTGSYRTAVRGWYLKQNHTVAVGTDGCFYVLSAMTTVLSRVRGVDLTPKDAPLVVGAGGRDGESIDLAVLLERRLAAGNDF